MDERERAAYYQEHKDDQDEWDEPEERDPARRRRTLSATITVRFTADEAESIRRTARSRNISYSDVVREAVRAYTRPHYSVQQSTRDVAYATEKTQQERVPVQGEANVYSSYGPESGASVA